MPRILYTATKCPLLSKPGCSKADIFSSLWSLMTIPDESNYFFVIQAGFLSMVGSDTWSCQSFWSSQVALLESFALTLC